MAIAICGTSYGQRRRGGVDRVDLILRESLIPKTPAEIEQKIDPSKLHPLTEKTYRNPKILGEDSQCIIVEVEGLKYLLRKQTLTGSVLGPVDEMRRKFTEVNIWESILVHDFVYPITYIGNFSFKQEVLTKVTIPNTVKEIGIEAFAYSELSEVYIPSSVEVIHRFCFSGSKIRHAVFEGETIKTIDSFSFLGCRQLEEIILPKSCTKIRRETFSGCTSLKRAVLPDNITFIPEGMFSDCTALTTVTFPTALTKIGGGAFRCTGLINLTLPVGLTTICKSAFEETKIQTLYIPSTVTTLEWLSFGSCMKLKKITMPNHLKYDLAMLASAFTGAEYLFCNTANPNKWLAFTWVE